MSNPVLRKAVEFNSYEFKRIIETSLVSIF
jgi:hypothetical protein